MALSAVLLSIAYRPSVANRIILSRNLLGDHDPLAATPAGTIEFLRW